jgi:hypothetical protein
VAQKLVRFQSDPARGPDNNVMHGMDRAGMPLVGLHKEAGQIIYAPNEGGPPERSLEQREAGRLPAVLPLDPGKRQARYPSYAEEPTKPLVLDGETIASHDELGPLEPLHTQLGSFLVWPKIEIRWDANDQVVQDVFLTILNDKNDESVAVQFYLIEDCDNWVDNVVVLTLNEPGFWSALFGQPLGVAPMRSLMSAREPDPTPGNEGGTRLRGYLLAWAVDLETNQEINWNYLFGTALTVDYQNSAAWEYQAWSFKAVDPDTPVGEVLPSPGEINLDGMEYDFAPAYLLLDFYSTGAQLRSDGTSFYRMGPIDTELTLWPAIKDLTGN